MGNTGKSPQGELMKTVIFLLILAILFLLFAYIQIVNHRVDELELLIIHQHGY